MFTATVNLDQTSIEEAIADYIRKKGLPINESSMTIDFTNGRGDKGLKASIEVQLEQPKPIQVIAKSSEPVLEEEPTVKEGWDSIPQPEPVEEVIDVTEQPSEEEVEEELPAPSASPKKTLFNL
jgi:hypothetical protein